MTRAIGTPLQSSYDQFEPWTHGDLEFHDLAIRAEAAYTRSIIDPPTTVDGLSRSTVDLDEVTAEFRQAVYSRATGHRRRGDA